MSKSLSIIIPYYNTLEYTYELLDILDKQITDEVEVILVDDGSTKKPFINKYSWLRVFVKENGGVSSARNLGLDKITGKYVTFIDSDDLVANNYISSILEKIKEDFDYCYLSWKGFGGWNIEVKLNKLEDEFPPFNLCCWNRIYKSELIKGIRFNENKQIAEDAEFIRDAQVNCKKKAFISDFMYLYRTNRNDSLTKRFAKGLIDTKRIVYNYKKITKDMTWLIDEVKKENETGEVIIMTNENEIPELKDYAMVMKPQTMKGTELRGEPTPLFHKIEYLIEKTQLIIWTSHTYRIGGIETFIYNLCKLLKDDYDILVLYNIMDIGQIERLEKIVKVEQYDKNKNYLCDNVIVNRITDEVPDNVEYKKKIQMVHCAKLKDEYHVPQNYSTVVPVSKIVKDSYKDECKENATIISNPVFVEEPKRILKLVSCTRLSFEKGEDRMIKLANLLNANNIPFMWFFFTERPLKVMPPNCFFMQPRLDVSNYIAEADYLVQLSDSEAFGYSMAEAITLGTKVLTTPIDVLKELGFKEGKQGYIIPFDVNNIDLKSIYEDKEPAENIYDNVEIKKKWKKVLGNTVPAQEYIYDGDEEVTTLILNGYTDMELHRYVTNGEKLRLKKKRARYLQSKGVAKILKED